MELEISHLSLMCEVVDYDKKMCQGKSRLQLAHDELIRFTSEADLTISLLLSY